MTGTDLTTRLTEREKEVLRAWLAHKSAKEIAIDLGISHHAVEKRLKMARTKLGAGSSREAARMLAEAEGYGRAVTAPPDLAGSEHVRPSSRYRLIMLGGIAMSLVLVLALALAPSAQIAPQADAPVEAAVIKLNPDMSPVFDKLDADASGYLEGAESPFVATAVIDPAKPDAPETTAMAGDTTHPGRIARFYTEADMDRDRRVSFREFHVWNSARLAAAGMDTSLELRTTPLPQS